MHLSKIFDLRSLAVIKFLSQFTYFFLPNFNSKIFRVCKKCLFQVCVIQTVTSKHVTVLFVAVIKEHKWLSVCLRFVLGDGDKKLHIKAFQDF